MIPVRKIDFDEPIPFHPTPKKEPALDQLLQETERVPLRLRERRNNHKEPKKEERIEKVESIENKPPTLTREDIKQLIMDSLSQLEHVYSFIDLVHHHMGLPTKQYDNVLFKIPINVIDRLNKIKKNGDIPLESTISDLFQSYYLIDNEKTGNHKSMYALDLFHEILNETSTKGVDKLWEDFTTVKTQLLSRFKENSILSSALQTVEEELKKNEIVKQSKIGAKRSKKVKEDDIEVDTSENIEQDTIEHKPSIPTSKIPPISHFGFIGVVPSFVEIITNHYIEIVRLIGDGRVCMKHLLDNPSIRFRFAELIALGIQKKICMRQSNQQFYYKTFTEIENILNMYCFQMIKPMEDESGNFLGLDYDDSTYAFRKQSFHENINQSKKRK